MACDCDKILLELAAIDSNLTSSLGGFEKRIAAIEADLKTFKGVAIKKGDITTNFGQLLVGGTVVGSWATVPQLKAKADELAAQATAYRNEWIEAIKRKADTSTVQTIEQKLVTTEEKANEARLKAFQAEQSSALNRQEIAQARLDFAAKINAEADKIKAASDKAIEAIGKANQLEKEYGATSQIAKDARALADQATKDALEAKNSASSAAQNLLKLRGDLASQILELEQRLSKLDNQSAEFKRLSQALEDLKRQQLKLATDVSAVDGVAKGAKLTAETASAETKTVRYIALQSETTAKEAKGLAGLAHSIADEAKSLTKPLGEALEGLKGTVGKLGSKVGEIAGGLAKFAPLLDLLAIIGTLLDVAQNAATLLLLGGRIDGVERNQAQLGADISKALGIMAGLANQVRHAEGAAAAANERAIRAADEAGAAVSTAQQANGTAAAANQKAGQALSGSELAKSTAIGAAAKALVAQSSAEEAKGVAGSVAGTAIEAKKTAEGAANTAGEAKKTAETASGTATAAKLAVGAAAAVASTAKTTAETAINATGQVYQKVVTIITPVQSTAQQAQSTANTAQSTAQQAITIATTTIGGGGADRALKELNDATAAAKASLDQGTQTALNQLNAGTQAARNSLDEGTRAARAALDAGTKAALDQLNGGLAQIGQTTQTALDQIGQSTQAALTKTTTAINDALRKLNTGNDQALNIAKNAQNTAQQALTTAKNAELNTMTPEQTKQLLDQQTKQITQNFQVQQQQTQQLQQQQSDQTRNAILAGIAGLGLTVGAGLLLTRQTVQDRAAQAASQLSRCCGQMGQQMAQQDGLLQKVYAQTVSNGSAVANNIKVSTANLAATVANSTVLNTIQGFWTTFNASWGKFKNWVLNDRVIGLLNLIVNVNNAVQVTTNTGYAIEFAADSVLSLLGIHLKDSEGNESGLSGWLEGEIKNIAEQIWSKQQVENVEYRIDKLSKIYQSATNSFYAVQGLIFALGQSVEIAGSYVAKIANALKRDHVVSHNSYDWASEDVFSKINDLNHFGKYYHGLDQINEAANAIGMIATDIQMIGQTWQQFNDTKAQVKEEWKNISDNATAVVDPNTFVKTGEGYTKLSDLAPNGSVANTETGTKLASEPRVSLTDANGGEP